MPILYKKLGEIYEIPLSNGKNTYGRLYGEYILGIYKSRYDSVDELPSKELLRGIDSE